jgi:hypothetical protein
VYIISHPTKFRMTIAIVDEFSSWYLTAIIWLILSSTVLKRENILKRYNCTTSIYIYMEGMVWKQMLKFMFSINDFVNSDLLC